MSKLYSVGFSKLSPKRAQNKYRIYASDKIDELLVVLRHFSDMNHRCQRI